MPKDIKVEYFAILRDQRGVGHEDLITDAVTVEDLYAQLSEAHQLSFKQEYLRVACNDDFVSFDYEISKGDCIAFFPPVSGG